MATNENTAVPALGAGRRRLVFAGAAALAMLVSACAESPSIAEVEASRDVKIRAQEPLAASPDSLIRLADAALAIGNRTGAIGLYNRAAMVMPSDAGLQVRLGFKLHELDAQLEAEAAFRRAIAVDLGNGDALRGLGITLISRDMPHHAIEYLEEAIAARPDLRAYNAMGVALDMVGERASAQEAYYAGLTDDPENLSLLNNLGLSLTLSGRYADAIAVLSHAVENQNATPRHRQNLALAYGLAGRPEKAAEIANTDLDMSSVRNNLGYYAWLRRQPNEQTEQALGTSFGGAAPSQLATATIAPVPEIAPEPHSDKGAAPMFNGALLEGAPLVLTPGAGPDPVAPAFHESPSSTEPQYHAPQDNVIWELQSVETDDPAASDTDSTDSGKSSETSPDPKGDEVSDGRNDETVDREGGEPSEFAADMIVSEDTLNNFTQYANEYDDVPRTWPEEFPATDLEVASNAATATVAPPATQTATLSLDDTGREAPVEEGTHSTAQFAEFSIDNMAIELPASSASSTISESATDANLNTAALAIPTDSSAQRQASAPTTKNAADQDERIAIPSVPIGTDDNAVTSDLEMGGDPAAVPNSLTLADNVSRGDLPNHAGAHFAGSPPLGASTPAVASRPQLARELNDIDLGSAQINHETTVADSVTPLEIRENVSPVAESYGNTLPNNPPETVLALAPSPDDYAADPISAASYPPDKQLEDVQPVATPRLGARPPGRNAGLQKRSTGLLRSGMSLGLGSPLSVQEALNYESWQVGSAEASEMAGNGIGRTQVGSLTPGDSGAAVLATASATLDVPANADVAAPIYGLAALILAGFLSVIWVRRRRLGDTNRAARTESGSEPDHNADILDA